MQSGGRAWPAGILVHVVGTVVGCGVEGGDVGRGVGAQGAGRGSGPEHGSTGWAGCATALAVRTQANVTIRLSASPQTCHHARRGFGRPVAASAVGGELAAIGQAPTIPLRIS